MWNSTADLDEAGNKNTARIEAVPFVDGDPSEAHGASEAVNREAP
jgi:hypothetical protein